MKTFKNTHKPISLFLAILLLLVSTYSQSASAAMIGTEKFFERNRNQEIRDYLKHFISREEIQNALVTWGLNPREAEARIDCLSDDEIKLISKKIDDLPAGGGLTGFILIVTAVVLAVILIVEYTSDIKMFPQFQSNN